MEGSKNNTYFYDKSKNSGKHYDKLKHIGPDDGFDSSLRRSKVLIERYKTFSHLQTIQVIMYVGIYFKYTSSLNIEKRYKHDTGNCSQNLS